MRKNCDHCMGAFFKVEERSSRGGGLGFRTFREKRAKNYKKLIKCQIMTKLQDFPEVSSKKGGGGF
jgi:hypothetical protein